MGESQNIVSMNRCVFKIGMTQNPLQPRAGEVDCWVQFKEYHLRSEIRECEVVRSIFCSGDGTKYGKPEDVQVCGWVAPRV